MSFSLIRCIAIVSLLGLAACTSKDGSKNEVAPHRVGMANPASEHCLKKGGKVEIKKNVEGGEYGMCHLPDGSQVEEWELFRRDNPPQGKQ